MAGEHAVRLSLPYHFLAIGIEGVVDDPFRGIERMIVFTAEMAKAFGDCFQTRSFRLLIERIVGIGAVNDLAEDASARLSVRLYFFKIASNEHSLP